MLIDKSVSIKSKYNYNLDYYKSLGYDVKGDEFIVDINDLLKNSFTLVTVSCDYCNIIEKVSYYKWNRSMESVIKKYCCKNCKGEKIKESNLLKYGVTSVAKLDSSKDKSRETSLERYGVEYHTQSGLIKDKIKNTNLNKLGVDNPMKSDIIKKKQKETIYNLYGVDNISKLDEIKDKKKETTFLNFGVDYPLKSEYVKNKMRNTNLERYGNAYFTKTEIYRKENYDIANDEFYINYIGDGISLFRCDYNIDHNFEINKDVYSKRKLYNVGLCTICNSINDNTSIKEKELFNFISGIYDKEIIRNYRIGKMEIDIFIPDLNIGFEFNGLYWHSSKYKDSKFHINKSKFFEDNNIKVIHIWEDDWDKKSEIIKSQISNLLNLSKRVFARNCQVKEIKDNKIARDFLNKNHIQGYVNSNLKLGLYYNDELVSIMSFDHFEGRKSMSNDEWNLNRFCNKLNHSVIGGASKLLKYFIENNNVKRIISYADRDWSNGNLYYKLGFKKISESKPDYKYIINSYRVHKSRFRKSKTNLSESQLDMLKIWDCGKLKFEISQEKSKFYK